MRTIYVKRNFPVILSAVALVISLLYLVDYIYFNEIDRNQSQTQLQIQEHFDPIQKLLTNLSSVMYIKEKEKDPTPTLTSTLKSTLNPNPKCSVTAALILCEADPKYLYVKKVQNRNQTQSEPQEKLTLPLHPPPIAKDFSRQINQTLVMLKSIAIQTLYDPGILGTREESMSTESDCVNVIILSDRKAHFEEIRDKIKSEWSEEFQKTLNLTFVPVKYPPGSGWMKKMFRPCATLRLFIPELLPPEYKSIIYLDTDFIFLRSLQSLQAKYFSQEEVKGDKKALAGMAPCLFHYGTTVNRVPYYGSSGLNAGLMVMNLKRMRESLWTNKIRMVTAMFQHEIKLADQEYDLTPTALVPSGHYITKNHQRISFGLGAFYHTYKALKVDMED